jgi:hypothetical protein
MNASNGDDSYLSAAATAYGVSYGGPLYTVWTYYFLWWGLIAEWSDENPAMEDVYEFVIDDFNAEYDDPNSWAEEYDGNPSQPFHLSFDKQAAWFQAPESVTRAGNTTLINSLPGYSSLKVTYGDWSNGPENRVEESGQVRNADLQKALDLINPNQIVTDIAPTCLFSHTLDYIESDGQLIARVGLCQLPELKQNHPAALVKFDENGEMVSRQGMVIPDAISFAELVENNL